jgi:hypothetical protein
MHDESLEPRAYANLHADRYLWQEQQERAAQYQDLAARLSVHLKSSAGPVIVPLGSKPRETGVLYSSGTGPFNFLKWLYE